MPAVKTAFVLAGGGSLGAVHVGMLKALVARGIAPDLVVGSSVGAINAAYFAGAPNRDGVTGLDRIWRRLHRRDVFPVAPLGGLFGLFSKRDYLVDPTGLRKLLERHLPYGLLEEAQVPCHVIATEVLGGSEVRLSSGPVVDALLASAAIPAVFPPVRLDGRYLVDGGIASNTPVSAAVEAGARRVIVLPTGIACALERPPRGVIALALHALNLLIARQLVADVRRLADRAALKVVPPLCPLDVTVYDFSRTGVLIDQAEETTLQWIDKGGLQGGTELGALLPHAHGG
ncbi:MAG: patatin-like phospholipase family protein [Deltaproteobacteria bacterium]|nr:patatin-like phospholipase family protein [Deltaproteobacteria bacterium]